MSILWFLRGKGIKVDKQERKIERPKTISSYVPSEIVKEAIQNTDIQTGNFKESNEVDENGKKWYVKTHECGCEFKRPVEGFGYSNHWCHEHAPTQNFARRDVS